MRAFKFRSAAQIQYVFDIILNRRLYCSPWGRLNDPMEGMFVYSLRRAQVPRAQKAVKGIIESKRKYRVCSLAGTFDCHLLWSHYAGGFDGAAIEIELSEHDPMIKEVNYRGVFAYLDMDSVVSEDEAAQTILFSKYNEWKYEREIRILSEEEWYPLNKPIVRVIAGHRMPEAVFDVLQITCERLGIRFCKVGIGDEGIDADFVPPSHERLEQLQGRRRENVQVLREDVRKRRKARGG